jgi:hypothetical protein
MIRPNMHTDFRFHSQVTQIGSYFDPGGHVELYLLEGDRLALIDTGCADAPERFIAPVLKERGLNRPFGLCPAPSFLLAGLKQTALASYEPSLVSFYRNRTVLTG